LQPVLELHLTRAVVSCKVLELMSGDSRRFEGVDVTEI
jgi:hypothetical protein